MNEQAQSIDDASEHASGHGGRIHDPAQALAFLLAGNAHATFVSQHSGMRFTYHVNQPSVRRDPNVAPPWFVSVLTAPDHYEYIGCVYAARVFAHGRKSRIAPDAGSVKAFAWVWKYLSAGRMPPECEVWHEGRCGKCGRRLTDPQSIKTGLGPICAESAS